ncbi:hypothetical protein [Gemmobacter serpentinus]|uniref:hypothetical protein n=1 Tax=Gemmobacter serpentinus TaxID=2652247 RepID=UPI00124D0B8B|nr:hypothetical protein [Gemmobacter serpentinus]
MKPDEMLGQLARLAGMIQDQRLEALRRAQVRQQAITAQLEALDAPSACDLSPIHTRQAELLYGQWVDARRQILHQQLDQQGLVCREALAAARLAFGKTQVLQQLSQAHMSRGK